MKTWALVILIATFGVAHADEADIASVFKEGDSFVVTDPYCDAEYRLRGLLHLKKIMKDWAVWKSVKREWGEAACVQYYGNSYKYEAEDLSGEFIRYFPEPVILDAMGYWIIEVKVKGESLFTYVIDSTIDGLKKKITENDITAASAP